MRWLLLVWLLWIDTTHAQIPEHEHDPESVEQRAVPVKNSAAAIFDLQTIHKEDWTDLPVSPIHPAVDSLLTSAVKEELLRQINLRQARLGKDTLLTSDMFYIFRPYINFLHDIDPHYRLSARIPFDGRVHKSEREFLKKRRGLGFDLLQIDDTLIVSTSVNPLFRKGDMVVSINGATASELLEYNYRDRYTSPEALLQNYYFQHLPKAYTVRLIRDNELITVTTDGLKFQSATTALSIGRSMDRNIRVYEEASCGYIALPKFTRFFNPRIIKVLRSKISEFKARNCPNVILDLRYNTGGSGYMFDQLLSLFIDQPAIPYLKSQKLRVSPQTESDYEFITEQMMGRTVVLSDEFTVKTIELNPDQYIKGINLYILMSQNTASIAASFCNILQYNGAATLVGEPLCRNALRYGETMTGDAWFSSLLYEAAVSTVEFDEHTNAVDGVLMPDIAIPYVARDYLTGRDAMLDKLLEIIKYDQTN